MFRSYPQWAIAVVIGLMSFTSGQVEASDSLFLGFPLGEPFTAPECATSDSSPYSGGLDYVSSFQKVAENCWQRSGGPRSSSPDLQSDIDLKLISTQEPDGLRELKGGLSKGRLESMTVWTYGLEYQQAIYGLLEKKYGKPSKFETVPAKNAVGGAFDVINAQWETPAVSVTFIGAVDSIDWGMIKVFTPTGVALALAKLERIEAERPTF